MIGGAMTNSGARDTWLLADNAKFVPGLAGRKTPGGASERAALFDLQQLARRHTARRCRQLTSCCEFSSRSAQLMRAHQCPPGISAPKARPERHWILKSIAYFQIMGWHASC
jgi:hypothetical protein